MRHIKLIAILFILPVMLSAKVGSGISLSLIPPTRITDKVILDIRAGIVNNDKGSKQCDISIYLNDESEESLLERQSINIASGGSYCMKYAMNTTGKVGRNRIILKVTTNGKTERTERNIEIISSDIRSTRHIDGAWAGLYHWSEIEGKHWNQDIKKVTDSQWKEVVRSMHEIGMDIIVIQEVFRNQAYVGQHDITVESYQGEAFYPSKLYKARIDITATDPIEAILSEADRLGMHVFLGVGLFAWFDFSEQSLAWHKMVARELWDMYGEHRSFYGFYVSEESGGSLDNGEVEPIMKQVRKEEIVKFFNEFREFCHIFAPDKPIMLATNSMRITTGEDTYPKLLEHLDILCPFGFARMPQGDLTGKQAADRLQTLCDKAGAHLWFDLEAFLFNDDTSLYPRDIEGIIKDLTMFDNFEKVLCYQYPGVFNNPKMSIRIGEKKTIELYNKYKEYISKQK